MADQKISQLTSLAAADLDDADLVAFVDTSTTSTKKVSYADLRTFQRDLSTTANFLLSTASSDIRFVGSNSSSNKVGAWNGSGNPRAYIEFLGVGAGQQNEIVFYTDDSASTVAEAMRIDTTQDVSMAGDLSVTGALSKGSGSFKIDHPLKPNTHHLVHSFIEGPQADNIYRGRVILVEGKAEINLDTAFGMTEGTFKALNGNIQCFTTNESGWTPVIGVISGNTLKIFAKEPCSEEISWMVVGERIDPTIVEADWTDSSGKVIVEPKKEL